MRMAPALLLAPALFAQAPIQDLSLANTRLQATLAIRDGHLGGERLELLGREGGTAPVTFQDDADFRVELIWNTMRHPPGKANNGDFHCVFKAKDFTLKSQEKSRTPEGQRLSLIFEGPEALGLEVCYLLPDGASYLKRKLRVFEFPNQPEFWNRPHRQGNLLHALYAYDAAVATPVRVTKAGGFGQPVALEAGSGGLFAGLEWPSADNAFEGQRLRAGQEMGEVVDTGGIWGETAVVGLTPDPHIKQGFLRYLDDLRVARVRPYTMYNSWYDLRNREFPGVLPQQVMNEENVLRVARSVRRNMIERNGITLDAFVLDDGWDVYRSAWELDRAAFPRGLKPIVDELSATGTQLGLWFGPMGGYDDAHFIRADWYRAHGYEVADDNLISIVGPKYAELFLRRTSELAKEGVGYFKWDGMQFVDNQAANGGPIGLYSRRKAMRNFIGFCREARRANPEMFLNLTSGTWLSPWWLRFGDTVWMDGEDYGLAAVPSISTRDSAITARDVTLHDDFLRKDLWFPAASLMTHGIIKGAIDVEGIGKNEPLAKFADEAVFYLARGVTMYELYISPDILSQPEWDVLSGSLKWARANFGVLSRGEMIGGDPALSRAYGHVHFKGDRGFLALRNPDVNATTLKVRLDPAQGLAADARDLALERIYPTRWVSPELYRAGATVELPLDGYESAVYELRPLKEIREPLVAGAVFEARPSPEGHHRIALLDAQPGARILNPATLAGATLAGAKVDPAALGALCALRTPQAPLVTAARVAAKAGTLNTSFTLAPSARQITFGILLRPAKAFAGKAEPGAALVVDGVPATPARVATKGAWTWLTLPLPPGSHTATLTLSPTAEATPWSGSAQAWITGAQAVEAPVLDLEAVAKIPARELPPTGRGASELPRVILLGGADLALPR